MRAGRDTVVGHLALIGLPPRRDLRLHGMVGPQGAIWQRLLREGAGVMILQPLFDGASLICSRGGCRQICVMGALLQVGQVMGGAHRCGRLQRPQAPP